MSASGDPTRMRNQPALTRSRGASWLVVGAVLAAVALAILIPMVVGAYPPVGVAASGAIAVVVLYAAMVIVRLIVPESRRRLRLSLLAAALGTMAVIALLAVVIVAAVSGAELARTLGY
ncbi:MAG: hypothetical protein J0G30_11445 [Actinomycetales bacterium]|nr:hypothetical protein [Actinomycetales bacterium]